MKRPAPVPLPPAVHEGFARVLADALGLAFPPARAQHLDAGVRRVVLELGEASPEALLARVRQGDDGALDALATALTIGETYFFRDPRHFVLLRRILAEHPRARGGAPIRLWSAGCASGEEAYSMAITAFEALGPAAPDRVEILGTDINAAFLTRARAGLYGAWSFRNVPDAVKEPWFSREGKLLRVAQALKQVVRFERLNLAAPRDERWPRDVDVVFCRNVLIYFDAPSVELVAARLAESLAEGGWLVTGPSDPLLDRAGSIAFAREAGFPAYRRVDAARGEPVRPAPELSAPTRAPSAAVPRDEAPARSSAIAPSVEAARLAWSRPREPEIEPASDAAARARALADSGDHAGARALLDRLVARRTLDPGVYVLRASLRLEHGDPSGATDDARAALLLDRRLAIAHVVDASARAGAGDPEGARRSLRNARALLVSMPPDEPVAHAGGATAAELLAACARLDRSLGGAAAAGRGGRGA